MHKAYELLLRARASGAANVSVLHAEHEKATTALQAAQLEADTFSLIAEMLEPQIRDTKAELVQAESDHAAARLSVLQEALRVQTERHAKAQEELNDSNLRGAVIQNRLARLTRTEHGLWTMPFVSFDRETLLTKGKFISSFEAEINAIGE